jgi:hypothetical protein
MMQGGISGSLGKFIFCARQVRKAVLSWGDRWIALYPVDVEELPGSENGQKSLILEPGASKVRLLGILRADSLPCRQRIISKPSLCFDVLNLVSLLVGLKTWLNEIPHST